TLYTTKNTQHLEENYSTSLLNKGDSLSPPQYYPNVEYSSKSITTYGLQDTQQENQITQQHTENTQQHFYTDNTDEYLKSSPSMDDSELLNNQHTRGGRVSPCKGVEKCTESEKEQCSESAPQSLFTVGNYQPNYQLEGRDWDNVKYDSAWDDGSAFPNSED
ncbi:MAG: hypothetical protein WBA41_26145, partial [Rivularia sp. (in: cyanobacteria)]